MNPFSNSTHLMGRFSISMQRRALLIFADSAYTDCKRRGWPSAFRILLETQRFSFEEDPGFDLHLFTSQGFHRPVSSSLQVHVQEGASFGQRLENAVESLARLGYHEIVIVGRDCPELEQSDILRAFDLLQQHRVVLGPDHRGGCYLIGLHANDQGKLHGIRWQRDTDFRQIRLRFAGEAAFELPVKIDLDTLGDVRLLAATDNPFGITARALLDSISLRADFENSSFQTRAHQERVRWQLPPPVLP